MGKIKYRNHKKGEFALRQAAGHFQRMGFCVSGGAHPCAKGVDLTITQGRKAFSVEVKAAGFSRNAWRTRKVLRTKDDFIAIVFPSGFVHVESMVDHLKRCSPNGQRFITKIAKLYV